VDDRGEVRVLGHRVLGAVGDDDHLDRLAEAFLHPLADDPDVFRDPGLVVDRNDDAEQWPRRFAARLPGQIGRQRGFSHGESG
jgi:hypothetical protein